MVGGAEEAACGAFAILKPSLWRRCTRAHLLYGLQDVINKIKDRKKRKEQLSDRKSLAAQNRMKSIATLASEEKGGKKRKRADKGALSTSEDSVACCLS